MTQPSPRLAPRRPLVALAAVTLALLTTAFGATAQEGRQLPRGEGGEVLAPELVGTSQGLLTRRVDGGRVVIGSSIYRLPAGTSVKDENGAVRSTEYLEPGMYVRFRADPGGGESERVLTDVFVQRHDPEAVKH